MLGRNLSHEQQAHRRERAAARRQRWALLVGSLTAHRIVAVLLMLACLVLVFAGVATEFGAGWAMIVTGSLSGALALIVGWE